MGQQALTLAWASGGKPQRQGDAQVAVVQTVALPLQKAACSTLEGQVERSLLAVEGLGQVGPLGWCWDACS